MKSVYRCRKCGKEFSPRNTPKKAVILKCPRCKSTDIEIVTV